MIVTTTETIAGKKIVRTLGLVRGNTIRARHIGKDIKAVFRHLIGGEITEYTKLMGESREQAIDRLVENAKALGGNAVLAVDLDYETIGQSGSMLMVSASGTAVVYEE